MKKILSVAVLSGLFCLAAPTASADVVVVPGGGPRGPVVFVPRGGPRRIPPPPVYHPAPPYHPPYHPPYNPPYQPPYHPPFPGPGGVVVVPGGGPLHTPPAQGNRPVDQDVADIVARSIAGLGCDRLSDAVRNLSNQLLANVNYATRRDPNAPLPPMMQRPSRPMSRDQFIQQWLEHLSNPELMQKLWTRLAELYRSCNRGCFDDGIAIGQLSGAGYCGGSIGAGGLSGIGVIAQAPLPLCQTSNFVGCQQGYYDAVNQYAGCAQYTSGDYDRVLRDFVSQDCHIE